MTATPPSGSLGGHKIIVPPTSPYPMLLCTQHIHTHTEIHLRFLKKENPIMLEKINYTLKYIHDLDFLISIASFCYGIQVSFLLSLWSGHLLCSWIFGKRGQKGEEDGCVGYSQLAIHDFQPLPWKTTSTRDSAKSEPSCQAWYRMGLYLTASQHR